MKILIKKQDGGIKRRSEITATVGKICHGNPRENGDLEISIINGSAEDLVKLTNAGIPFMVVIENSKKLKKKNYEIFFFFLVIIIGLILAITSPHLANENKFVSIGGGALYLIFSTLFLYYRKTKISGPARILFYSCSLFLTLIGTYGVVKFPLINSLDQMGLLIKILEWILSLFILGVTIQISLKHLKINNTTFPGAED
ncbi:hypothetical protein KKC17_01755 [Patescibacteria group bacterium]|nr:hypothetical protein [Patescibacteria group bacterium]